MNFPADRQRSFWHYPIISIAFLFSILAVGHTQDDVSSMIADSVINDPSLSRRCEALLEELNQKRAHKQKLTELIVRNERMQRVTPTQKRQLKRNLELNYRKIERELDLSRMKIQRQEESLIRGGCPGVILE